ncbi:MAG TPA: exodeoxyribonuclease VII small subunit [Gemmatimonadaceae bacterium]|nr:exodeoxyribonuclease VII small subunit [Gemmatimonadaceae bacterium]
MTFEKSLARLEQIVAALDGSQLSLDQALSLFEEGIACLRQAAAELTRAEGRLLELRQEAEAVLGPLDLSG